jgi:hypothetical protein
LLLENDDNSNNNNNDDDIIMIIMIILPQVVVVGRASVPMVLATIGSQLIQVKGQPLKAEYPI